MSLIALRSERWIARDVNSVTKLVELVREIRPSPKTKVLTTSATTHYVTYKIDVPRE